MSAQARHPIDSAMLATLASAPVVGPEPTLGAGFGGVNPPAFATDPTNTHDNVALILVCDAEDRD
ncbi:MAG: hypothetical protein ACREEZ_06380 [Stellaceae bacterium]